MKFYKGFLLLLALFIFNIGAANASDISLLKKMIWSCHDVGASGYIQASAIANLGEKGAGFKTAMRILDKSRTHIAAVCVGVAERIIEESLKYIIERKQFGKKLGLPITHRYLHNIKSVS